MAPPGMVPEGASSFMGNSSAHSTLVDDLLLEFGGRPFVRLWKQPVAKARALHTGNVISFGVPGMADLGGIVACGRRIEVEVKTGRGRLTPDQVRWRDMVLRFRGIYLQARGKEDLEELLAMHLAGCTICRAARDDPSRTLPPPPPPPEP